MEAYSSLNDHIQSLQIIDTHEHLPLESARPQDTDVLVDWLQHYFSSDLVSAGLTDDHLSIVRDSRQDIKKRWMITEPYRYPGRHWQRDL